MKKIVIAIIILFVFLVAFSFVSSTAKIDMSFVTDWFSQSEPEEQQGDIAERYYLSGNYQLVELKDGSVPDTEEVGFTEERVSFGLVVQDKTGNVTGYNGNKVTWEQLGDVKIYYFGSYTVEPGALGETSIYVMFGKEKCEVSEDFYEWFNDHFEKVDKVPEIALTLDGAFEFKNSVSFAMSETYSQPLTFISNGEEFTSVYLDRATSSGSYCDMYYGSDGTLEKVWSYTDGWIDESYRVIEISDCSVNLNFYAWFMNAAQPYVSGDEPGEEPEIYKIASGTYSWNSVGYPDTGKIIQEITATWNGMDIVEMMITCMDGHPEAPIIAVKDSNGGEYTAYYDIGFSDGYEADITVTECEVSKEFYDWFTSCTTLVS